MYGSRVLRFVDIFGPSALVAPVDPIVGDYPPTDNAIGYQDCITASFDGSWHERNSSWVHRRNGGTSQGPH